MPPSSLAPAARIAATADGIGVAASFFALVITNRCRARGYVTAATRSSPPHGVAAAAAAAVIQPDRRFPGRATAVRPSSDDPPQPRPPLWQRPRVRLRPKAAVGDGNSRSPGCSLPPRPALPSPPAARSKGREKHCDCLLRFVRRWLLLLQNFRPFRRHRL